ncbi:MAG: lysine--tRNA ligase [Actinomycetaceae bacterium]|nr:lysine--tRNA ligase [Actinomycetaceae bacterium]MDO5747013.1 lysine--tRNA ligase [Actinomycetaceae bacterium]
MTSDDLPEQVRVRSQKRQKMLDSGIDPYPVELPITATIAEVRQRHEGLAAGEETDDIVGIAGRIMFLRNTGKLCFVALQQGDGTRIQAMLSANEVGKESLAEFKAVADLGDHLFIHGRVIASKRGELSVFAIPGADDDTPAWAMAAKAIRPLPKTFINEDGEEVSLSEEMRVRKRHLDMIMREDARKMVRVRAAVMRSLREYFHDHGYIEVETPMLQTLHGGAAARPFSTHMNAYDTELYLRIAPELFLKRCVVGGIDRVFEINRNFRNEGADSSHSPEFTMLEAYQAYGNYDQMARTTREFIQKAARDAFGSEIVTLADGTTYDLSGEWDELDLYESLSKAVGEQITPDTPKAHLLELCDKYEIEIDPAALHGKVVEELWEETVGNHLWAPTFVRDYPVDTSPLTRGHRTKPGVVEKWDLYVRGFELATAYSELIDPVIQRERLEAQSLEAAKGDPEAMQLDHDFIEAMEQGMPPAGGMGMGIDRLLMALTGQGIRETITFPLVKNRD